MFGAHPQLAQRPGKARCLCLIAREAAPTPE